MMQFKYFVGIDTSKDKLDICFYNGKTILAEFIILNSARGLAMLFKKLKKICKDVSVNNVLFCVEHTGVYNNHLFRIACTKEWCLVVEPAIQIKKSMGIQRGKNDRIDASRIARYAYKNREELRFWKPMSETLILVKTLSVQRSSLMKCKTILSQSISEDKRFQTKEVQKVKSKHIKKPIKSLEKSIIEIDVQIDELINNDPELKRLDTIITSVKGVGRQNSVQFLVNTNAFKTISNPRKYACYGGVAPFEYTSGSSLKGKARVSKQANLGVKTMLQMAAINASRFDPGLKEYYQRKVESGKHKMSVLNAIRNKIIHRVFACVRDNRIYSPVAFSYA